MSRDICVRFGQRVMEIRKKKGWSQIRLAEHVGIDRAFLSLVENGKKEICLRNVDLLAQGLGVSLRELFTSL